MDFKWEIVKLTHLLHFSVSNERTETMVQTKQTCTKWLYACSGLLFELWGMRVSGMQQMNNSNYKQKKIENGTGTEYSQNSKLY